MPAPRSASLEPEGPPHRVVLLQSRFRFANRFTVFGQARFYPDRITLRYGDVRGWHRLAFPLEQVADLDYHVHRGNGNLSLFLIDGTVHHLLVQKAHRWREAFEQWLHYRLLASAKFLGEADAATDLSG